jgi:hypothetical protein
MHILGDCLLRIYGVLTIDIDVVGNSFRECIIIITTVAYPGVCTTSVDQTAQLSFVI